MTGTAQRSRRADRSVRPEPSPVPGRLVAAARLCGLPRRQAAALVRKAVGRPGTTDDATLVAAVAAALPGALDAAPHTAAGDIGPVGEAVRALPGQVRMAVALDAAVGSLAAADPDLVAEGHRQLVPAVAPSALLWSRALDDVLPALEQALTVLVPPPRRRRRPMLLATVAAIAVLAAAGGGAVRIGESRTAAPSGSDRLPIWVAVLELGADPFALNPAAELVERVAGVNTFTDALECYDGLDVGPVDESTDWFLAVGSVDRADVEVLVRALGRTPIVLARVVGTCTLPPPF